MHGSSAEGTIICWHCVLFIYPILVGFPHIVLVLPPALTNVISSFSCVGCLLPICHQSRVSASARGRVSLPLQWNVEAKYIQPITVKYGNMQQVGIPSPCRNNVAIMQISVCTQPVGLRGTGLFHHDSGLLSGNLNELYSLI